MKNLRSWQPGQSGNPSGKPRLPDELRGIHSLTRDETRKLISKYARMTIDELRSCLCDPKVPALELCIASIFDKCIDTGDFSRLSFLLDQAIGKVPIAAESPEELAARMDLQTLTTIELIRIAKEKIPQLEAELSE